MADLPPPGVYGPTGIDPHPQTPFEPANPQVETQPNVLVAMAIQKMLAK